MNRTRSGVVRVNPILEVPVLFGSTYKTRMITPDEALPGRATTPYLVPETHAVLGTPLKGPWPEGTQVLYVAMGCFWGAERIFWQLPGVVTTAVGYQGGITPNPTYEETCTGRTGHAETVLVAYDPKQVSTEQLLKTFWESHDPTQGFRQGNDTGTQYRSAIYTHGPGTARHAAAEASRDAYQKALNSARYATITTEILPAADRPFYPAEGYHQQYLDKNPAGYCGVGGTGIACPTGIAPA
jgi:peptide-methionine (S)-S-oxide reductase